MRPHKQHKDSAAPLEYSVPRLDGSVFGLQCWLRVGFSSAISWGILGLPQIKFKGSMGARNHTRVPAYSSLCPWCSAIFPAFEDSLKRIQTAYSSCYCFLWGIRILLQELEPRTAKARGRKMHSQIGMQLARCIYLRFPEQSFVLFCFVFSEISWFWTSWHHSWAWSVVWLQNQQLVVARLTHSWWEQIPSGLWWEEQTQLEQSWSPDEGRGGAPEGGKSEWRNYHFHGN